MSITENRTVIIRLPEVLKRTGSSRSTIRRLELAGLFPRRVRVGHRGVGWIEAEVDQYLKDSQRISFNEGSTS